MSAALTDGEIRARLRRLRKRDPVYLRIVYVGVLVFGGGLLFLPDEPFEFWMGVLLFAVLLATRFGTWLRIRSDLRSARDEVDRRYRDLLSRELKGARDLNGLGWVLLGMGGLMAVLLVLRFQRGKVLHTIEWTIPALTFAIGLGGVYTSRVLRPRLEAEWQEWEAAHGAPDTPAAALQP